MTTYPTTVTDRRWRRFTPAEVARALELYRAGLTDRQIAARLPSTLGTAKQVNEFRRRHRLPRNSPADDPNACYKEAAREFVRNTAAAYGLPPDLQPVLVATLIALADGPLTAERLAARVGNAVRRVYIRLGVLQARGLVVRFQPVRGQRVSVYLLSAAAMAALEGRGE